MRLVCQIVQVIGLLVLSFYSQVTAQQAYGQAAYRESQIIDLADKQTSQELVIGFGSCYGMHNFQSKIFKAVNKDNLDVWIWLGDVAYADKFITHKIMSKSFVKKRYEMTEKDKYYVEMAKKTKIIGVWDDHDYGKNNADKRFKFRDQNREIFLDFVNEPSDTQRRLQTGSAIHQDYLVRGPDDLNLHVILIDNRYDADHETYDILGADQWKWLDNALSKTHIDGIEIDVTLLGSGIQVIPDRIELGLEMWKWKNKEKLFAMLAKHQKSNLVLMSGDVHFAQFYDTGCKSMTGSLTPEITSSGLTHTQQNYIPLSYHVIENFTPHFWSTSLNSMEFNYGKITLYKDKETKDKIIKIQANDDKGGELLQKEFNLSRGDLQFDKDSLHNSVYCQAKSAKQKNHLQIAHSISDLIARNNVKGFIVLILPIFIISWPIAWLAYLGVRIIKYVRS